MMNRCYECGKRNWGIGHAYWRIRRWFRLLVGWDKPPPPMSPMMRKFLNEAMSHDPKLFRRITEIRSVPTPQSPGGPVIFRPIKYATNHGKDE